MVKIVIENLDGKELEVNDLSKTVLSHFQDNRIDWLHECGGRGKCTTCMMKVVRGNEFLSAPTPAELNYQKIGALHKDERLTCQAKLTGNIRIRVPEESKLPHIKYSD